MVHYEQCSDYSFFCFKFVTLFVVSKSLIHFESRSVLNDTLCCSHPAMALYHHLGNVLISGILDKDIWKAAENQSCLNHLMLDYLI